MATNAPQVRLDRVSLTQMHLKAMEIALYQAADVIDRLLAAGAPYTKVQNPQIGGPDV